MFFHHIIKINNSMIIKLINIEKIYYKRNMTSFKNFLGTRNGNRLKTFFRDSKPITSLENAEIQENVVIGQKYKGRSQPPVIGKNAFIRSNSVIYDDTEIGDNFRTGHGIVIREKTKIGDNILIGTTPLLKVIVPLEVISVSIKCLYPNKHHH